MEIYLRHSIDKKKGLTPLLRGESARPGSWSGEKGEKGEKGTAGKGTACPKADRQELLRVVYTLDSQ